MLEGGGGIDSLVRGRHEMSSPDNFQTIQFQNGEHIVYIYIILLHFIKFFIIVKYILRMKINT